MKSIVFWDIKPCSPAEGYRRYSETSLNFCQTTRLRYVTEERIIYKMVI
jgi:hypothetical protein